MRGKLFDLLAGCVNRRITPAGAGKTGIAVVGGVAEEDHPRRCGENVIPFVDECRIVGSPPQVRGKLSRWAVCRFLCRITPAGAGKTPHKCGGMVFVRDHPRRCGENLTLGQPSVIA